MNSVGRDYNAIRATVRAAVEDSMDAAGRMRVVVDALWNSLHSTGVSWVGFYLDQPGEFKDSRLVLGPCRNKPACSPIGLYGLCGKALTTKRTCIVDDVRTLGSSYIACDPRDLSEIVVPLVESSGECWAVLDLDSWETAAFSESDDAGLRQVLQAAGLMSP